MWEAGRRGKKKKDLRPALPKIRTPKIRTPKIRTGVWERRGEKPKDAKKKDGA